MNASIWAVGLGIVLATGVLTYALTRRYGWGAALTLPLLAVAATIAMQWQNQGLGFEEGLQLSMSSLLFSAPVLLGAVAGIAIARLRRG